LFRDDPGIEGKNLLPAYDGDFADFDPAIDEVVLRMDARRQDNVVARTMEQFRTDIVRDLGN
jgi:hypothetical protein